MNWLEDEGYEYTEIDVSGSSNIKKVPVTEIDGEQIIGFDRPAIKRALRKTLKRGKMV